MRPQGRTAEQELARIAGAAHGVVTRAQLLHAGVTRAEIKQRLRTGSLIREHRGVYRVGHQAPGLEARYLAAVRACGDRALLSGRSAAHLLGLLPGAAPAPEVTAPAERRIPGVKTRRARQPHPEDRTTWRKIPVTTVARTLVDLAGVLAIDHLARACHEAGVRHGTTPAMVEAVLARRPNTPGAAKLRQILRGEVRITLSKLESRFLERLRAAGLVLPGTNRPAGGRRVDCRWPEQQLTVELDGYRYHHSRHAWEQDRRREREARARGDEFRRYTYGDVFERPDFMLSELRALLPACRHGRTSGPS
ncbi:MAG: type IV toxin-antitoxin system AbiEi family antitoxin domain-containing protein [Solirubrobacterales bacterium]